MLLPKSLCIKTSPRGPFLNRKWDFGRFWADWQYRKKKALIRLWATFEGWVWVGQVKTSMNSGNTLAKSNCTHYSTLSGPPDISLGFGTLKKNQNQNTDFKKVGSKKRVIIIQKVKRQPGPFSFWIKMTLFFSPCFFLVQNMDLIFFRVINWPKFSKQE